MPDKTFTQEQVNGIVARETKPLRERISALESEVRDHVTLKGELTNAAQQLVGERDQARAERDDLVQRNNAAAAAHRQRSIASQITAALIAGKVISEILEDVAPMMLAKSEVTVDDDGTITSVVYNGKTFDTVNEAAKQFLLDKPHFAQAPGGGGGTRPPTGGRTYRPDPAEHASAAELMRQGWNRS